MDDFTQPDPRTASSAAIRAYAAARGVQATAGKMAIEAGVLSAFVHMLCSTRDHLMRELQNLRGIGLLPAPGCHLGSITLGDSEVPAEYELDPGDPGCYRTRNGDGWPEIPPSVALLRLYINGSWSDAQDVLDAERLEKFEQQLLEYSADAQDAAAEADWERRQERDMERGYP